jgi:peptide/nickel transport system ATP-binding protein
VRQEWHLGRHVLILEIKHSPPKVDFNFRAADINGMYYPCTLEYLLMADNNEAKGCRRKSQWDGLAGNHKFGLRSSVHSANSTEFLMEVPFANAAAVSVHHVRCRTTEDLLQVRDLTVRFCAEGREFTALDRISFDIAAGEIVGLLGESGCGKTTLGLSVLRLLPEAARATCNSIFFRGRDLCSLDEFRLRDVRGAEVAIIYQDSSVLNPVIRVGNQVTEVLRAHRTCTLRQAREEAEALFAAIGLRDVGRIYNAYPHQLSGGQRQRIAIAQALICKPHLVIADEPTASVDRNTACEIIDFMRRMNKSSGTSFLFISHDPATLAAIADRIMVMYAGQIVENGPLGDVYSQPLHPYAAALLQCAPQRITPRDLDYGKVRLPCIPGKSPNPLEVLPGCSFSSRCRDRMEICDLRSPEKVETSPCRSVCCFKYAVK